jgi:hypothetical protein
MARVYLLLAMVGVMALVLATVTVLSIRRKRDRARPIGVMPRLARTNPARTIHPPGTATRR